MDWPSPSRVRDRRTAARDRTTGSSARTTTSSATLDTTRHTIKRARVARVHEQLARHAALRLDAARPEPVQDRECGLVRSFRRTRDSAIAASRAGTTIQNLVGERHARDVEVTRRRCACDLPEPLAPHGGKVTIAMDYRFAVPEHGSDRMARDGPLYEIAQWYPRVDVVR